MSKLGLLLRFRCSFFAGEWVGFYGPINPLSAFSMFQTIVMISVDLLLFTLHYIPLVLSFQILQNLFLDADKQAGFKEVSAT